MPQETSHFDLAGTRAAVLGSTSGIGRAVALALAEAGADVVVHGRRVAAAARGSGRPCCVREASGPR